MQITYSLPVLESTSIFRFDIANEKLRLDTSVKKIGMPRIEKQDVYNFTTISSQPSLLKQVWGDYFSMDDPTIPQEWKDNNEFTIDISDPSEHKLTVHVKKNQTRADEQKKVHEKIVAKEKQNNSYKQRIDKNHLILYIDNLSRANFKLRMPLTAEWLTQFVDNDQSYFTLYQFFRYHSIWYSTIKCNSGFYYGDTRKIDDAASNIMDEYSRNGFITAFVPDTCKYEFSNINAVTIKDFHRYDHFGGTVACDPNYEPLADSSKANVFLGSSSALKR
jgi:hypothetical protein